MATALWLGIMTSISPCPLATNIAAVSFLSKQVLHVRQVVFAGCAYTAGRMLAYMLLGVLIITSLLSVPSTAQFLQRYMSRALGPVLLLVGLVLFGVLRLRLPGFSVSVEKQQMLARSGGVGAFSLGFLFALSFCPISAALFFGSLIPLALQSQVGVSLPLVYGLGTALPVLVFALAVALGVSSLSGWFQKISVAEAWMRKLTGLIFFLVGIYYTLTYTIPL